MGLDLSPYDIIIKPVFTEKSERLMQMGKYTFIVHIKATKPQIKKAVEKIFGVKVKKVNTMIYRGKVKRRGWFWGRRSNFKKAIVTLKEGKIDFAKLKPTEEKTKTE